MPLTTLYDFRDHMIDKHCLPSMLVATFLLSACGGSGSAESGGSAAPASAVSAPSTTTASSAIPASSVATPTYAASSAQATGFRQLNAYRLQMGVGELAQDPVLDTSAQAHAKYLNANFATGAITALTHDEVSTLGDYYDDAPLGRAQKAGAPATEWIGEAIGDSQQTTAAAAAGDCVGQLLATVYHAEAMTDSQQTVGIGFTPLSAQVNFNICNFDFGSTTGVYGTPQANAIPVFGGQQMATTAIATMPLANETGVHLAMTPESPSPAPSITAPGRPLMVRVNAASAGDVLTVSSFTLTDASGNVIPGEIMIPSGAASGSVNTATVDPNGVLGQGIVFFIPSQPLTANTVYTASFSGSRDGTPINSGKPLVWSFTTGAN
jgi:uncharacterized protein YkwD